MTNVNIPAVASGVFVGLMALAALIWCFPPITRFLGDLCCCPWRLPFTRKKQQADDEEMDKDDLPDMSDEPLVGTPVDSIGYHRMSAAYMSAISVVDPETAMIEARRSPECRRDYSPQGSFYSRNHSPASAYDRGDQLRPIDHYERRHSGSLLQVPQPNVAQPADQRRSDAERHSNYPVQASYDDETRSSSPDADYQDIQPPEPAYSPPETGFHQHADGYLPLADRARPGTSRQQSSEVNVLIPTDSVDI